MERFNAFADKSLPIEKYSCFVDGLEADNNSASESETTNM